jgi:hypothetical protein
MIGLGDTFRCDYPPRHIWVVINNPQSSGGKVLMVNMTTLRDSCIDDACILGEEDYNQLSHATTIAYSRAMDGPISKLEELVKKGEFITIERIPPATLEKIIAGAKASIQLAPAKKRLLPP